MRRGAAAQTISLMARFMRPIAVSRSEWRIAVVKPRAREGVVMAVVKRKTRRACWPKRPPDGFRVPRPGISGLEANLALAAFVMRPQAETQIGAKARILSLKG